MNKNPKVGIVITSYQRLAYLKQAVESAVNQTYKNIEILIIDDHSPNPHIKTYLRSLTYPQVRYLINPRNIGVTKNYDKGVRSLSRDVTWCLILDNDDYLDKKCIEEAVKIHLKYPRSQVIHCRQIFIGEKDTVIGKDINYPLLETAEDYITERANNRREIRSSSVFFARRTFEKIGGYPRFTTGLCTDAVFIFALTLGNVLAYADKAHVYTRLHSQAESHILTDLTPKFNSITQMTAYCQKIFERRPDYSVEKRQQVMRAVAYYEKRLIMVLLTGKLHELLLTKPLRGAHISFAQILKHFRKDGISIPTRSLIISYVYAHVSFVLERFGASASFMFRLQRLGSRFIPLWLKH